MSGAASAVPGSVEAGAQRELQPGDKEKDKHRVKENNKCTNITTKSSKNKVSWQLQKEDLQTGDKDCVLAKSDNPKSKHLRK